MTIGNAKATDLFANRDNKTFSIQVKAIRNRKSSGWPMKKNVSSLKKGGFLDRWDKLELVEKRLQKKKGYLT